MSYFFVASASLLFFPALAAAQQGDQQSHRVCRACECQDVRAFRPTIGRSTIERGQAAQEARNGGTTDADGKTGLMSMQGMQPKLPSRNCHTEAPALAQSQTHTGTYADDTKAMVLMFHANVFVL